MSHDVNFIDLNTKQIFSFDGKAFINSSIKDKNIPIVSRLLYQDITTYSFQAKNSLSKNELLVEIELKMYEEAGLDPEQEYKILHIIKNTSIKETSLIEVFMINKNQVKNRYQDAINIVQHIDYLVIPPLSFEILYKNKILTQQNDLFVYISKEEAFVAFYQDGIYLSSKKIESINDMIKYFNTNNIQIELNKLENILLTKGLDKSKYAPEEYNIYEHLQNIFTKLFIKIDNLAIHNRSIFGYTKIDRVFFGVNNNLIPNLKSVTQSFTKNASFYGLNFITEKNHNVLNIICALYARNNLIINDNSKNITFIKRKQPFYKTELGKLSLISASIFLIIGTYTFYKQYKISNLQNEVDSLTTQYEKSLKTKKLLQNKLKTVKKEKEKLITTKKEIDQKIDQVQNIINTLINLKSADKKYTSTLVLINKLLKKHHLSIDNITQTGKNKISIELYSANNKRDKIAKFMSELLNKGFIGVTSNKIKLSDLGYKSKIEIQK